VLCPDRAQAADGQVRVGAASEALDTAQEVPGTAALNQGGHALIYSVSCTSAGNCGAAGVYRDNSGHYQAFVVKETPGPKGHAA
jgi:hypothetical protein